MSGELVDPIFVHDGDCRRSPISIRGLISLLVFGIIIAAIVGCIPSVEDPQNTRLPQENIPEVTAVSPLITPANDNTHLILEETPTESSGVFQDSGDINADYSELFEQARTDGTVFVIVSLRLPVAFQPEGNLPNDQAVGEQREIIAATQDALQRELQDYNIRIYKTYETIPTLAMEVDEVALEVLISSPLVEAVYEDVPID